MNAFIEFHDSKLLTMACHGTTFRIGVDAYVHRWEQANGRWKGTGWMQPVQSQLACNQKSGQLELPVDLGDGEIIAGEFKYRNLAPLPFVHSGSAILRLELVTGKVLEFEGHNVGIASTGDGRHVEDLPEDWRPQDVG